MSLNYVYLKFVLYTGINIIKGPLTFTDNVVFFSVSMDRYVSNTLGK